MQTMGDKNTPYIMNLKGKIQGGCELTCSRSRYDENPDSFLENKTLYEIINTKINNSIDDTKSIFNLELAAKIKYSEVFPETNYFKVPLRKGKKESEKGLGFATINPSTLINKYNEVFKANVKIPSIFSIQNIFEIKNKKLEITLPPYMGIFVNDPYIFSEVFKIENADVQGFHNSESPKYFDKLAYLNIEDIENLDISEQTKNELIFASDDFFGFKNPTSKIIKIVSDNEFIDQPILKSSSAAKVKNEIYNETLQCYLDEMMFLGIDFYENPLKGEFHVEKMKIELNLFDSVYQSALCEAISSLVKSLVVRLIPSIELNNFKQEWDNDKKKKGFHIVLENYSNYMIDFDFYGNETIYSLLGYTKYHYSEILFGNLRKLPKTQKNTKNYLLSSNLNFEKRFILQPFPYYIIVKNAESENLYHDKGVKDTTLGLLYSDSTFTSVPIKMDSNKKMRISLIDSNNQPLKYAISLILHLKCIDV